MLDEAGYPRGADGIRLKIVLDVGVPAFDLAHSQLAASYWGEIGVDVEVREGEWGAFQPKLKEGDFDMFAFVSAWENNPMFLITAHTSDAAFNPGVVRDPKMDAMVADVQAATTLEERKRLTKLVDMYIIEQHYHIWGSRVPQMNVFQPWIVGYAGECELGDLDRELIAARVWIDSELKEAMGH